jgi:hypothetical protein
MKTLKRRLTTVAFALVAALSLILAGWQIPGLRAAVAPVVIQSGSVSAIDGFGFFSNLADTSKQYGFNLIGMTTANQILETIGGTALAPTHGFAASAVGTLQPARLTGVSATPPTCTYTSGGGTSPSCAVSAGSTDLTGTIVATTGTGAPTAAGSITLTYSAATAYGTNSTQCVFMAQNAAGSWTAPVTFIGGAATTTSYVVNMTNGAAPGTSLAFNIHYDCTGR